MKNQPTRISKAISRRAALAGIGGAGAISVAGAALAPGLASAAPPPVSPPAQMTVPAGTEQLFLAFFAAKSAHSPDRTMAFFDQASMTYADGTLGQLFPTWAALKALFDQYMPQ
jgi:hypothetical protein